MKLLVKQNERTVTEFQTTQGPVSIGRLSSNNICLASVTISKVHAKILTNDDGKWIIEDMGSANKTYLNETVVKKAEIKTGDRIRIADYTIEISLDDAVQNQGTEQLEDTIQLNASLANPIHDFVVRKPDAGHAPAMRLKAKRLVEFSEATEKICSARDLDELLLILLDVTLKQFEAQHIWCALRDKPSGPMMCHAGKDRLGKDVLLDDLSLKDKVVESVEKAQFVVMPRVKAQIESAQRIRSALIASIMRPEGCYGVLYVDNSMMHEHYSLSDLDYLMLVAIHTASQLKHILNL